MSTVNWTVNSPYATGQAGRGVLPMTPRRKGTPDKCSLYRFIFETILMARLVDGRGLLTFFYPYSSFGRFSPQHNMSEKQGVNEVLIEPLKQFARDSIHLVKKCTKPDRKEFTMIARAVGTGCKWLPALSLCAFGLTMDYLSISIAVFIMGFIGCK